MIVAEDVHFAYGDAAILDGVRLTAGPGRLVGVVGPNGSGKTTFLRTLYAALNAQGRIEIDGEAVPGLSAKEVSRRMAVVVQEHGGDLPLKVSDMVLLGRLPHRGTFARTSDEDAAIAAESLRQVGAADLAGRDFATLSGGEKQRVLIARALSQQTTHLLLDEPTNHLDIRFQHEVLDLARRLTTARGITVVVVLHDLNLAASYCDDLLLLDGGRVVKSGPVGDVLDPKLLSRVYRVDVRRLDLDGQIHLAIRKAPSPEETT